MSISLNVLGPNMTRVTIGDKEFYFSYNTCVAYRDAKKAIRTDKYFSKTTQSHLKKMGVSHFTAVSQDELNQLCED